jgi:nucleotide-binding universal stress UspA family protein
VTSRSIRVDPLKEKRMLKLLVPVDGSESSHRAIEHAIDLANRITGIEIHLVNVQPPIVSGEVVMFVGQDTINKYHQEESEKALKNGRALLDEAGIAWTAHAKTGHVAETIVRTGKDMGCYLIVMGTRGMSPIKNLVLGSVATQVIHLTDIPVTLVK